MRLRLEVVKEGAHVVGVGGARYLGLEDKPLVSLKVEALDGGLWAGPGHLLWRPAPEHEQLVVDVGHGRRVAGEVHVGQRRPRVRFRLQQKCFKNTSFTGAFLLQLFMPNISNDSSACYQLSVLV